MGKCLCCGKKGLFLKTNKKGLCYNCANGGYVLSLINKIPEDIRNLLFINHEKVNTKNYLHQTEPSNIITSLDAYDFTEDKMADIGYYPEYKDLTPGQRNVYLNWLINGAKTDIAIGYIFIYYYGLERRMCVPETYISARDEILRLVNVYKDTDFPKYTYKSLLICSLRYQDLETYKYSCEHVYWSLSLLLTLSPFLDPDKRNISAKNIISSYREFNYSKSKIFDNNQKELSEILENVFAVLYGFKYLPIIDTDLVKPKTHMGDEYHIHFVNPSLDSTGITILDFSDEKKDIIKGMLLFVSKVFQQKKYELIDEATDEDYFLKYLEQHENKQEEKKQKQLDKNRPLIKLGIEYGDNFIKENINGLDSEKGQSMFESKIRELKLEEQISKISGHDDKAKEFKCKWKVLFNQYQIYSLENGRAYYPERCRLTEKDKSIIEELKKTYS